MLRYAQIRSLDISDGFGVGVSLFTQGCHFHCKNCFNKSTWDFNGGKEWTKEVKEHFLELVNRPHIERVSILGGEPLCDENYADVLDLVKSIEGKKIWIYTGYTYEDIKNKEIIDYVDYVVDGRYIDELRDLSLQFRGSSNQRIIDIKKGCSI